MVERAAQYPLHFHPGDRWEYGDSTDYVAVLVEKISGQSIDDFLRTRIFEPLGMRDTHYNVPREKVNRTSAVYRPLENGKIELLPQAGVPRADVRPRHRRPQWHRRRLLQVHADAAERRRVQRPSAARPDDRRHDVFEPHRHRPRKRVGVRGDGYGFGLGGAVLTDPAKAPDALSIGTWSWGGAWGTVFWIDPVEELIPIMLIQITSYSHFNIRPLFSVVASQAVVDSLADQKPKVMGYDTPR